MLQHLKNYLSYWHRDDVDYVRDAELTTVDVVRTAIEEVEDPADELDVLADVFAAALQCATAHGVSLADIQQRVREKHRPTQA